MLRLKIIVSKKKLKIKVKSILINDKIVSDLDTLYRIKKLGIPPGWKDTHISKDPLAYLQVTGIDAKGKKQYIYHPVFIELTTNEKFKRIKNFCKGLKLFINRVNRISDTNTNTNNKESIICLMFKILYRTYLRVGNYGQNTYGLTTLEKRHVKLIEPDTVIFDFIGKKNVRNYKVLKDSNIFKKIKQLINGQGQSSTDKIFITSGHSPITSLDMNNYIQEYMGPEFSCKDFRTYASNILFIQLLSSGIPIKDAYDQVATELCHTKNISKKSYITNKIEEIYKTRPELFNKKSDPIDIFLAI